MYLCLVFPFRIRIRIRSSKGKGVDFAPEGIGLGNWGTEQRTTKQLTWPRDEG
jgi:hypothetical protein